MVIPRKSKKVENQHNLSGDISNLVLACRNCNRLKKNLDIPKSFEKKLSPDWPGITEVFYRDDQYYIKISEGYEDIECVIEFYERLRLGSEIHRLDYLLMSMIGLNNKLERKGKQNNSLPRMIEKLREKRNRIG